MSKLKIIGLNWKMNPLTLSEVKVLVEQYNQIQLNPNYEVIVFVPDCYLRYVRENLKNEYIVGAQDVGNYNGVGAFTGEVSLQMICSVGAQYSLVGHSETRKIRNLSEKDIIQKLDSCQNSNIIPILCIGYGQLSDQIDLELIKVQVISATKYLESNGEIIIAFEPVGSIGTGKVLEYDEIIRVVGFIKSIDSRLKVIYGGSVSDQNINNLNQIDILDGYLIGGASLKPKILKTVLTH
jgi:triosephosphate isomerase (TIM)